MLDIFCHQLDLSTDGRWCFVVFWVVPRSSSTFVQWTNLKNRLISVCPTYPIPFIDLVDPVKSKVYLLKLFSLDRKGLLHGNAPCYLLSYIG